MDIPYEIFSINFWRIEITMYKSACKFQIINTDFYKALHFGYISIYYCTFKKNKKD